MDEDHMDASGPFSFSSDVGRALVVMGVQHTVAYLRHFVQHLALLLLCAIQLNHAVHSSTVN